MFWGIILHHIRGFSVSILGFRKKGGLLGPMLKDLPGVYNGFLEETMYLISVTHLYYINVSHIM